jgi:hypothetical protein
VTLTTTLAIATVTTADAFLEWYRSGIVRTIIYFVGDMAEYRFHAGDRISWLQTRIDRKAATIAGRRAAVADVSVASEETEATDLQKTVELLRTALRYAEQGRVLLTQRRLAPPDAPHASFEYRATRAMQARTGQWWKGAQERSA